MKFDNKRMRDLRESKGMSQEELATAIGKKRQQINLWEKGTHEPGIDIVGRIAKVLGVPGSFLIPEE